MLFPKYNPFEDVKGRRPVDVAGRVVFPAGRVKLETAEGLAKPEEIPVPVGRMEFALTPPFTPVVVFANGAPDVYGKCPVPAAVPGILFVGLAKPNETPEPVGNTDFTITPPSEPAVAFKNAALDVYGKWPVPAAIP